jgi:hypothetical protein
MVLQILLLILCISFHGLGLLARFVAYNFHFSLCLGFRSTRALSQSLLDIFLLSPYDIAWSQVFLYSCSYADMGCPLIEGSAF